MKRPTKTVSRRMLAIGATLLGTAAVAHAAAPDASQPYDVSGTPVQGVRPTAVGLPRVGEKGTFGAVDMSIPLLQYHDSGAYERDLDAVDAAAMARIVRRAKELSHPATPARTCKTRYVRVSRPAGSPALYRRARLCHVPPAAPGGKPAVVLDIDETSLSNYSLLAAAAFADAPATLTLAGLLASSPAIKPTLGLYRYARVNGIAVFFITGRPAAINSLTESNLKSAGYDKGWDGLMNKTSDKGTMAFKSGARAEIEKKGYTIVANVGDQESDLAGGHAEEAFKLPNPFYFISE